MRRDLSVLINEVIREGCIKKDKTILKLKKQREDLKKENSKLKSAYVDLKYNGKDIMSNFELGIDTFSLLDEQDFNKWYLENGKNFNSPYVLAYYILNRFTLGPSK